MFTEAWFSPQSCAVLERLVQLTDGVPGAIIEVGSWEGRSTVALANAAHPHEIHAVDTWEGSPGEISAELASERDVFATFRQNIAELTQGNVVVHRMGWREFFDGWISPIRLCFIDAEHTYTEVRDNIEAVLPWLSSGGVICGDDQHHPPIRDAVVDTLGNALVDASVWWARKE